MRVVVDDFFLAAGTLDKVLLPYGMIQDRVVRRALESPIRRQALCPVHEVVDLCAPTPFFAGEAGKGYFGGLREGGEDHSPAVRAEGQRQLLSGQ